MKRKFMAVVIAASLAASMMAGCGSSASGTAQSTSTATEAAESTTEAATEAAVQEGVTVATGDTSRGEDGVLRVITHRTWSDLLPLVSHSGSHTYEYWGNALMQYDYGAAQYGDEVRPELAESYEWNEAGDEITFKLRDGVKFSNGDDMKASDVAWTYQHLFLDDPNAYNTPVTNFIDKVTADNDNNTVTFHIYTISPRLWEAFYTPPILDQAAYEADPDGYMAMPIGTGGWTITKADPTTYEIDFARNPDSWWWDYYGYETNIDTIILTQNSEESSRVSALRAGEVDCIENISPESAATLQSEGFITNTQAAVNWNCLGFNVHEGSVLQDVKIREAIAHCIDRQAIVDAILGGGNYVYDYPCRDDFMGYKADSGVYD